MKLERYFRTGGRSKLAGSLPRSPMGGRLMCFAFPKIGFAICEGFVVGGERRNRLGILLHPWVTECTTPNLDSHT